MSLQDDYYDVLHTLEVHAPDNVLAFERIWFAFCDIETQQMVRVGELTPEQYWEWHKARKEKLKI